MYDCTSKIWNHPTIKIRNLNVTFGCLYEHLGIKGKDVDLLHKNAQYCSFKDRKIGLHSFMQFLNLKCAKLAEEIKMAVADEELKNCNLSVCKWMQN